MLAHAPLVIVMSRYDAAFTDRIAAR
jgi:hypothetical protein